MDCQQRWLTILPGRRDFLKATSLVAGSAFFGTLNTPCRGATAGETARPLDWGRSCQLLKSGNNNPVKRFQHFFPTPAPRKAAGRPRRGDHVTHAPIRSL